MTGAVIAIAWVVVMLLVLVSASIRRAREYERGVVFRLGRLHSPPKGPGVFLLVPIIDKMVRVDLRSVPLAIPPQEVVTKDDVPVRVTAVADMRIIDPEKAIVQAENFMVATSQSSQAAVRTVVGRHALEELLSQPQKISAILQRMIDEEASSYGVTVPTIQVTNVEVRPAFTPPHLLA
jgi:regulator of protease activity HflC (stomatin/prohibitin superfamily)